MIGGWRRSPTPRSHLAGHGKLTSSLTCDSNFLSLLLFLPLHERKVSITLQVYIVVAGWQEQHVVKWLTQLLSSRDQYNILIDEDNNMQYAV